MKYLPVNVEKNVHERCETDPEQQSVWVEKPKQWA